MLSFLSEFSDCLSNISTLTGDMLITGDFNVHFDDAKAPLVKELSYLLTSCGLHQYVTQATHKAGNCLDGVMARLHDGYVTNITVSDTGISDQSAISFTLQSATVKHASKVIISRKNRGNRRRGPATGPTNFSKQC